MSRDRGAWFQIFKCGGKLNKWMNQWNLMLWLIILHLNVPVPSQKSFGAQISLYVLNKWKVFSRLSWSSEPKTMKEVVDHDAVKASCGLLVSPFIYRFWHVYGLLFLTMDEDLFVLIFIFTFQCGALPLLHNDRSTMCLYRLWCSKF